MDASTSVRLKTLLTDQAGMKLFRRTSIGWKNREMGTSLSR